ncbi:diflavin flavoprotein A [Cylindrospermopsis raciborskii S07]|uniref:diflavin flavoprotein n=1 Tax=Cylindrospermopsis raciborskii TaxID=77022 RepID=UPI000C9E4851|nr:diflavin flavoprotein [Cylindrospermopsis raciborskii]PNK03295.1 diflavin flavoprotein A [Cylindrospermopsis raciborskii S14]PNK05149.1 diflavin flavoprotein A [Cylindrospermopsis raciborskii S10]PNK07061.1 diflavin flavoprotein A [Cylindrospermopsis raciborskii S07]PNK13501.1 diflavin flavoprotein A [Cylindrospermopsis raciborskii S05]PNK16037.1 diflavin flavoprotein A [Cylindrospermopsis raciborskii S06]
MVLLTDAGQEKQAPVKRLTTQTVEIAQDTTAIRSLDWDRDRFDIEFGLQNGTTYNSFLIRGEQIALVDTSHEKFRHLYFDALTSLINLQDINYLIISHTEPDHSGLVKDLLQKAPDITVVGSKVAIQFLEDLVHQPFKRRIVKNGDRLSLGNGHELEFVMAPNLHWPDTIFSFDYHTETLYTCDAFGMHYCSDSTFDDNLATIEEDFKYYYDCLMGPNSRSVLSAIKRMAELKHIKMIATGHGPLLYHNVEELTGRYRTWSQSQTKAESVVGIFYLCEYGYSDRLAQSIANGVMKTGLGVEMVDLGGAVDLQELRELVGRCKGLVLGMSPVSTTNSSMQAAVSTVLGSATEKQAIGIFETGGGDDEPTYPLLNKFRAAGLMIGFPVIEIRETPTENTYKKCEEAGTDLGQLVTKEKSIKAMKSLGADLDKALGRISGGLYIITAKKGDVSSAMLASWVSQSSFKPLGFSIAVAKDRAIESLMQVGDRFVLNVLEEGNYQTLMKHFLKRFAPGADRFEGVKTQPAENGAPILSDALAYMECEVVSRMDCGDHWAVYSTVYAGRVSKPDSLTAVHHRKVGNHY